MGERAAKFGATLQRAATALAILLLAGAVLFLLSERNARSFGVELQAGELVVNKGRMLPVGSRPYAPAERVLAEAYAPFPAFGDVTGELLQTRFEDRDALDRALFRTLRGWAEPRVESDDPKRLKEAVRLIDRMALLRGISDEQHAQLTDLRGRIAYFEGRMRLEESLAALRGALGELKLAGESGGRYAKQARALYDRLQPLAERMAAQARAADRLPSAAPADEPPAEPETPPQAEEPPAPEAEPPADAADAGP
ncbi:MAG: IF-2 protein [Myxococcales bacterium]